MTVEKRLLLFSNSTNFGGRYLGHAGETISNFLGDNIRQVLLIEYAGVTTDPQTYEEKVANALRPFDIQVAGIHSKPNALEAIQKAQAIVVGGGNTFVLLEALYQHDLMEALKKRVEVDGIPYIGWSAGSVVAGPTIKTTNDMPISEPLSFNALNLISFQINAHYSDAVIPEHNGETRRKRLAEFHVKNPHLQVVGIPEGSHLEVSGDRITSGGTGSIMIFRAEAEVVSVPIGASLNPHL